MIQTWKGKQGRGTRKRRSKKMCGKRVWKVYERRYPRFYCGTYFTLHLHLRKLHFCLLLIKVTYCISMPPHQPYGLWIQCVCINLDTTLWGWGIRPVQCLTPPYWWKQQSRTEPCLDDPRAFSTEQEGQGTFSKNLGLGLVTSGSRGNH